MANGLAIGRTSLNSVAWLVGLVGVSVLLNYVDRGAIGVAAPLMKAELGLSATGFGLAVSSFFWIYAPMNLAVGWLCDRYCVYRVFAAGVAIWAGSTFLTGWIGGVTALIFLRLTLGLGESIAFPGSSKIFAAEVPAANRGIANAVVAAALAFGPAVGTLAGGTILSIGGWRPIFWVFGALTLLWLVPWSATSRPFRKDRDALRETPPVPVSRLLRVPALWSMGAGHFMANYGFYFLLAWLPLFLVNTRGYTLPEMTLAASIGFVAQGIAALAWGHLSDHLVARGANEDRVRRWTLASCQVVVGLAIAGVFVAQSQAELIACLVLAGIGSGAVSVNLYAVAQIFGGPRHSGSWVGAQNALGNISGIVGPIATGLIVDRLGGYGWGFALAAGIALLGALWWIVAIPPIREVDLAR